jgi:four helix bundle protein
MIKSFLDLEVYKESFQLSIEIEELLKTYPVLERFLLIDQMRRASRSIPAQIAEGYARREALKDFQRYIRDCIGESNEMINHLLLSKHKGYIKKPDYVDELIGRYNTLEKKLSNLKNNWQNFK